MRLPWVTICVFSNKTIARMDQTIKQRVEEKGDFGEPDNFLARLIWNQMAAPRDEKARSKALMWSLLKK